MWGLYAWYNLYLNSYRFALWTQLTVHSPMTLRYHSILPLPYITILPFVFVRPPHAMKLHLQLQIPHFSSFGFCNSFRTLIVGLFRLVTILPEYLPCLTTTYVLYVHACLTMRKQSATNGTNLQYSVCYSSVCPAVARKGFPVSSSVQLPTHVLSFSLFTFWASPNFLAY